MFPPKQAGKELVTFNYLNIFVMRKMNFMQMENLQGGTTADADSYGNLATVDGLTLVQHGICALMGFGAASCTFGAGAAFGYLCCISLLYVS
ncbi:MAG: hypothetical protein EZS26_000098 [Candidatus Ordinivivax streblomastigis]|uniref:Uncharacterized protein n=1 Tax=Candidatus Ordinivivax streblomastigis TaxID=2540710 RepID=A0A5M8P4V8_9BACT|nr:MAG: hypothetical protein EZS26_000098 [Candidatus Ordinivivax streblomastigis]